MTDDGCHWLTCCRFWLGCFRFRCICFCSLLSFFLSCFRSIRCFFCRRFLCGSRFCRCLSHTFCRSRASLFRSSRLFLSWRIRRLTLTRNNCGGFIYRSFYGWYCGIRSYGFLSAWSIDIFRCSGCSLLHWLGNVINLLITICRFKALYSNSLGLFNLFYAILHPCDVCGAADSIFPIIHI